MSTCSLKTLIPLYTIPVGKRRTLLLCGISVTLAFLVVLVNRRSPREPAYAGHPLSFWVAALVTRPSLADQEKATNAILSIDTAALPFLLKWIQFDPPPWRRTLARQFARPPFPHKLPALLVDPTLANGTYLAFAILGTRAMPAFDDLCRLMNATNKPNVAIPATRALACLGTNALPPLIAVVTNSHGPARVVALEAIATIPNLEQAAQQVIPAICSCLSPTNSDTPQILAVLVLSKFKSTPELSVPALVPFLRIPSPAVRAFSANTLGQIGPQAFAAIPALTNCLADADPHVRNEAARALNQIAPATFTNSSAQ